MNLGNVIYDVKTHTYYTPNTDSSKKMSEGGDKVEKQKKRQEETQQIRKSPSCHRINKSG